MFLWGCINGDSQACVNRDYKRLTAQNVGAEKGHRRGDSQRGVRQRGQGRGVWRRRGLGRGGTIRGRTRGNIQRGARQRGQGRRGQMSMKRKGADNNFSSSDSESETL